MLPAYEDELATVYLGDCLTVLREMSGASVDALVTDPPAGIAFMNRGWDTFTRDRFIAFMTEVMAECLRVLKPGGHALVWAIPRTSHWTATAIEDAGFEVRDVVTHHFGSGFPKSLDVSKAIDKAAGAERESIGEGPYASRKPRPYEGGNSLHISQHDPRLGHPITAAATDAAKQWQGWGTALKPASEHWILARKPLAEPNVAGQVLASGTGALNIDACRVPATSKGDFPSTKKSAGVYAQDAYSKEWRGAGEDANPSGRWPANLVLTHSPDCRQVGTRKVKGTNPPGPGSPQPGYHGGGDRQAGIQRYAAQDGSETVEAWECAEGCPVAELDRQSGDRPGFASQRDLRPTEKFAKGIYQPGMKLEAGARDGHNDRGGASRFYPTFRYTAKASGAERNAGLFDSRKGRNLHPTVKPVELMRWLCRLITPPGGVVLDPFAGSGTTLLAAKLEGFRAIGIEKEPEHVEIIKRRLGWGKHQPELFPEVAG